ncbi:MAG: type III polyketide synthase [Ktedonobacteraceae bacterium]
MVEAYINQIATAVPEHDVHRKFLDYAPSLLSDERQRNLLRRMANRAQIEYRYSFLKPHPEDKGFDADGFNMPVAFPDTQTRMRFYERHALTLAIRALDQLNFAAYSDSITHLILTTCTGFYAPGINMQVVEHYGLDPSAERTVIGFMGCNAGLNALKLSRHIVRSEPSSQVAILNLELCTLHLQETNDLEQMLSFLIFADGSSASLVSAQPVGIELQSFTSTIIPKSADQITWHIGDLGFDMVLMGQVPSTIITGLPAKLNKILDGQRPEHIEHWAVHPGGRTILDAVQRSIGLPNGILQQSRDVLRRFGNMSSATVMFVLNEMMKPGVKNGRGCSLAFGPGLTVESMLFQIAS